MAYSIIGDCPRCGSETRVRTRHKDGGQFVGCINYPECTFAGDYDDAVQESGMHLRWALARIRDLESDAGTSGAGALGSIRGLVYKWHPDRHPRPVPSVDIVAALNAVVDEIKGGQ